MIKQSSRISPDTIWVIALLFIYGMLVTFGISSSSLSLMSLDGQSNPGVVLNSPQAVRSDEFLRSTPLVLADFTGGSGTSSLDVGGSTNSASATSSSFKIDTNLLSPRFLSISIAKAVLDDRRAFSALWWLPTLTMLLFLPLYLRKIGVSRPISVITTFLILFSTSANWWSLWPIENVAPTVAGAYLGILGLELATKKRSAKDLTVGLLCMLASVAFLVQAALQYVPWSLPINVFFFALTIAHVKERSTILHSGKKYLFGYIVLLCFSVLAKLVSMQSSISVTLATVYPGARRFLDGGASLNLFSGNLSWALQEQPPNVSNQSELATSNIELFIVVLSFIPITIIFRKLLGKNLPLVWGAVALLPFLLWTISAWPNVVSEINPLRFMPPDRIVQILGIPSIITFGLFATMFRKSYVNDKVSEMRVKSGLLGIVLIPILFMILDSNRAFASLFAQGVIPPKYVWGCAFATVIAIFLSLIIRNVWLAFAPMLILSLSNVISVNPIVVGLGDLQDSNSAKLIQGLNQGNDQLWASDNFWVDALLMSNGAKLASGQQGSGPNVERYELLDPTRNSIGSWNRGASYVSFIWLDNGKTEISSPSADQIRIAINPCSSKVSSLEIKWVVSSRPLSNGCSTFRGDFLWMGSTYYVYERT